VEADASQGFTFSNHGRALDNPLNGEVFTTLREVERVKPDVFLFENVPDIVAPFRTAAGDVNVLAQVVRRLVGMR
jgi:site-specific DNA-cytosine methylase